MKEKFRVFHYSNGFNFRLEGIVTIFSDNAGKTLITLTSGEIVVIVPGWVATSFKEVLAPTSSFQLDTDGDQTR